MLFAVLAIAATFLPKAMASGFDASAATNLAVYWGQGADQGRLSQVCQQASNDIIALAFLHIFPDQGAGGYPGTNFGNACGPGYFTTPNGTESQLLSGCADIAQDIALCQSLGKKILLSIGGATPPTSMINDDTSAVKFADFVWGAFGPKRHDWTGPRPFGDAAVDGFDFDIEHNGPGGYAAMITRLRRLYQTDLSKRYYISGAPQCVIPDAQLSDAIKRSWFDFIFVQWYNTESCSARAYINGANRQIFDDWVQVVETSFNPNAKIFIGLPADSTTAVWNPTFYLNPTEVATVVNDFRTKHPRQFGGVMLWEARASDLNPVNGKSFAAACKAILMDQGTQAATLNERDSTETQPASTLPNDPSTNHPPVNNPASTYPSGKRSDGYLYDYSRRARFIKVRRNSPRQ
ncbi:MAG: hypothetical protein M1816_000830 [Peltula sp. TS41687]|nr:MAG: hypothetical protein M1816_000830 [Peltula sp. TS41687]